MPSELYFDSSSLETGGSLFRVTEENGRHFFLYDHSSWDAHIDEIKVYKTAYPSFEAFWNMLTGDREWFYRHPLYVHPQVRSFVAAALEGVNWTVQGDRKWQESHRRQWEKVLSGPEQYYKPLKQGF